MLVCPYFYIVLELLKWECQIRNSWLSKTLLKQGEKNHLVSMRGYFLLLKKRKCYKFQACFLLALLHFTSVEHSLLSERIWGSEFILTLGHVPAHMSGLELSVDTLSLLEVWVLMSWVQPIVQGVFDIYLKTLESWLHISDLFSTLVRVKFLLSDVWKGKLAFIKYINKLK